MDLQERVYKLLIISSSTSLSAAVKNTLPKSRFSEIQIETSESQARRLLSEKSYDLVIINSPLPEDAGLRLAIDIANDKTSVPLIMVSAANYLDVYSQVMSHGVLAVAKPIARTTMLQAFDDMCAYHERLRRLAKKTSSIEDKMKEIRLVNKAKWILIDSRGLSEEEAHRYIGKIAMDTSRTKASVAEEIINETAS